MSSSDLFALFQNSPDATMLGRPDGSIFAANAAACALLGYSEDELCGLHQNDISQPGDSRVKARIAERTRSGFAQGEHDFWCKDGSSFLGEYRNTEITLPDGRKYFCISFRNVTHQRSIEQQLRNSEQRYRVLVSGMLEGVVQHDADGRIVSSNPAAREILALSEDQLMGRTSIDPRWRTIREDGSPFPGDEHPVMQSLRTGVASRAVMGVERPGGEIRWVQASANPLFEADSKIPNAVIVTFSDMTERFIADKRVQASESRFRAIMENSPIASVVSNNDGEITYVNNSFVTIFGYKREDAPTIPDLCLLAYPDPEYRRKIVGEWEARIHQAGEKFAEIAPIEAKFRCKNGVTRNITVNATEISRESGGTNLAMFYDITWLKLADETLRASEQRLNLLTANSADMISLHDDAGRYVFASAASIGLIGYSDEELHLRDSFEFIHPDDQPKIRNALAQSLTAHEVVTNAYRIRHKDGSYVWVESTARAAKGRHQELIEVVVSTRNIGERVQVEKQLQAMATTDFLTGLSNRRYFITRMEEQLARVRRDSQQFAAVMMLDLDYFKRINDEHGHPAGDSVLKYFAELIGKALRKVDVAARIGGEEFAIILTGADIKAAQEFAERLRRRTETAEITLKDRTIGITVSIGVTMLTAADQDIETVIAQADAALYRAKNAGRNCVVIAAG